MRISKRLTLAASAAVIALFASSAMAEGEKIVIGTEGAYPPFNNLESDGPLVGFDIDIAKAMCEEMKAECTFVTQDWDGIIPALIAKKFDAIIASMSITDERKQEIDFTQNYLPPAASAYAALSADTNVGEGAVVAAQTATIQAAHVAESGATLLEFGTPDETVAAVRNGEAQAAFADKDFLEPVVAESNGELAWVGEDVALGGGLGVGIRKSDTELRDKMDAAITSMKEDGSLNALSKKWFGEKALQF